ncbi:unnamed protein product [Ectocarpus fasciculatus]
MEDTPLISRESTPHVNWLSRAWSWSPWGTTAAEASVVEDVFESDLPAAIGPDILSQMAEFVGDKQYLFFAPVSKDWRSAWGGRPTVTSYATPHTSLSQLRWSLDCGLNKENGMQNGLVLTLLARTGDLQLLEVAHKKLGCPLMFQFFFVAAGCGHLDVLIWATRTVKRSWDISTSAAAAKGGHLHILRWGKSNGQPWRNVTVCSSAAAGGQLHVLRWLRENGCPWNLATCTEAARGGHLATIQWARQQGCPWSVGTCAAAATGGPHILRWLREHGCPWDANTCIALAEAGDLATLRWAKENGCPWVQPSVLRAAARGGNVQVLQYVFESQGHNQPLEGQSVDLCKVAAGAGHLDALKWARGNGYHWDECTCMAAAKGGHLEVLQWLRQEDCPWDHFTILMAARHGKRQVWIWARENGCDLPPQPPKPACCCRCIACCHRCIEFFDGGQNNCCQTTYIFLYCFCLYLPAKWCGILGDRISNMQFRCSARACCQRCFRGRAAYREVHY